MPVTLSFLLRLRLQSSLSTHHRLSVNTHDHGGTRAAVSALPCTCPLCSIASSHLCACLSLGSQDAAPYTHSNQPGTVAATRRKYREPEEGEGCARALPGLADIP